MKLWVSLLRGHLPRPYAEVSNAELSKLADSLSRYTLALACVRRIEAGAIGLTSPSKQAFTACAFRESGTTARISFAFRICRIDIEIACLGTCDISPNQPSPTCWRRQASSRLTIR